MKVWSWDSLVIKGEDKMLRSLLMKRGGLLIDYGSATVIVKRLNSVLSPRSSLKHSMIIESGTREDSCTCSQGELPGRVSILAS